MAYYLDELVQGDTIPLTDRWTWKGNPVTGHLEGPNGESYVQYDLFRDTVKFAPGVSEKTYPGMTLRMVQDMGEQYIREIHFTEEDKVQYQALLSKRAESRKEHNREVRAKLTGVIRLHLTEPGQFRAEVDNERLSALTGLRAGDGLDREGAIHLFNAASDALHADPLQDPTGYMRLDRNLVTLFRETYEDQYNDALDLVDAQMLNATGRAMEKVLADSDRIMRSNVRTKCLPKGVVYQDLYYISPTPESEALVQNFVTARRALTIMYEKKRSYEKKTLDNAQDAFTKAGDAIKDYLRTYQERASFEEVVDGMEHYGDGLNQR